MRKSRSVLCGVDFGAQRSGNTVVAVRKNGRVTLHRPAKGQKTDPWLLDLFRKVGPALVAIDAPLSLPGRYTMPYRFDDYFYRSCDRELRAMSPMFLGGLTSRAMFIRDQLRAIGAQVIETYPRKIREAGVVVKLNRARDKHEEDALLSLSVAVAFERGAVTAIGDPVEGVIWLPEARDISRNRRDSGSVSR